MRKAEGRRRARRSLAHHPFRAMQGHGLPSISKTSRQREVCSSHRLAAQVATLSRWKREFESRWEQSGGMERCP